MMPCSFQASELARLMCVLLCTVILTGCDMREAAPGNNLSGTLRLTPVSADEADLQNNVGLGPNEGGDYIPDDGGSPGLDLGQVDDNTSVYPETRSTMMAARSYTEYLRNSVVEPIKKILSKAGYDQLYFRVVYTGYNPDGAFMSQAPAYTDSMMGAGAMILGGTSIPTLAGNYIGNTPLNKGSIALAKTVWLKKLNGLEIDDTLDWMTASQSMTSEVGLKALKLWRNPRLDAKSFAVYKRQATNFYIGTVPDISLSISTSFSDKTSIVLNPTTTITGNTYYDNMDRTDVDKLFAVYNQYPSRDASFVKYSGSDADHNSIVKSYIDGYSKVILILGSQYTTTLEEELGAGNVKEIRRLFTSLKCWTSWKEISALVENPVVIQAGTKEVQ